MNWRRGSTSSPISRDEHFLGLDGVGQINPQQFAPDRIHRGLKKFLGVHFAETFEAGHLDAFFADGFHAVQNFRDRKQRRHRRPLAFALDQFKQRLVLRGIMIHGQALLGKFAEQIGDGLAFQMQIGNLRAARRAVFLALDFRVAVPNRSLLASLNSSTSSRS